MKHIKNVPASVRQRILDRSRTYNRPFGQLVQYYAMERFLYRLSKSQCLDRFVLKGALMLQVWGSPDSRPTMDIDMLGRTRNDENAIVAQIRQILAVDVDPDGLLFDPASIEIDRISKGADYEGLRVRFRGKLDSVRINMQIDIGFGDVVFPGPELGVLPALLDSPAPGLFCYSRESAIAEKFHAMVVRGPLNSRMKDFFDIWLLSKHFSFEYETLFQAVKLTFDNRRTAIPEVVQAFEPSFVAAKGVQWSAFRNRLGMEEAPVSFGDVVSAVYEFLAPVILGRTGSTPPPKLWNPSGPWIC